MGRMKETVITYREVENSDFFYFTKETICFQPAIFWGGLALWLKWSEQDCSINWKSPIYNQMQNGNYHTSCISDAEFFQQASH